MSYDKQTQEYSTFGDKLLQHCDVLGELQENKKWKPITVQICPTAVCDFNCSFCSVKNRDKKLSIPFKDIKKGLRDFRKMGAKALEISGGGNPLLYKEINELIAYAHKLGYKIGLISNSTNPGKHLTQDSVSLLSWYRASLSGLDHNKDYEFSAIPEGILGFSYIVNEMTTKSVLESIVKLVKIRPDVKFVRIAPNCLNREEIKNFNEKWGETINKLGEKFFIKEVSSSFTAYPDFCGVGMVRPYCAEDGYIYTCSSFLLRKRHLEDQYRIGKLTDVKKMYRKCNDRYAKLDKPYHVNIEDCYHCFYYNNNKLLDTVTKEMTDKDFA